MNIQGSLPGLPRLDQTLVMLFHMLFLYLHSIYQFVITYKHSLLTV